MPRRNRGGGLAVTSQYPPRLVKAPLQALLLMECKTFHGRLLFPIGKGDFPTGSKKALIRSGTNVFIFFPCFLCLT